MRRKKTYADDEVILNFMERENSIKFKHLSKAVQGAVEQKYSKEDIVEIEEVNHFQKGIFMM